LCGNDTVTGLANETIASVTTFLPLFWRNSMKNAKLARLAFALALFPFGPMAFANQILVYQSQQRSINASATVLNSEMTGPLTETNTFTAPDFGVFDKSTYVNLGFGAGASQNSVLDPNSIAASGSANSQLGEGWPVSAAASSSFDVSFTLASPQSFHLTGFVGTTEHELASPTASVVLQQGGNVIANFNANDLNPNANLPFDDVVTLSPGSYELTATATGSPEDYYASAGASFGVDLTPTAAVPIPTAAPISLVGLLFIVCWRALSPRLHRHLSF
jgi:hypothetical protein